MVNQVAKNSLGMLDCISLNILLHIPHSSTTIPSWEKYEINPIKEVELLTDWASDKIFDLPYYEQIVFPYSRVFCDVERLAKNEPMEDVGMGFFYTHTDDGKLLRFENNKKRVYNEYYIPHHEELNKKVDAMLSEFGEVLIVDCHTFSDIPFQRDIDKNRNRPDICIGVTKLNTNKKIVKYYSDFFEKKGFRVAINQPYSGSMLPLKFVGNSCVQTIMIEINRKLYMSNNSVDKKRVKTLNKMMREVIMPLEIMKDKINYEP